MNCGKSWLGSKVCRFRGKGGKCTALFFCYYADTENSTKTREEQFHLF